MKITAIETLRTEEFANVLWVRVHTDSGIVGLGETFYGAGAVEAHIHDTLAGRLLGRNPLHIEAIHREMVNLPMAQSSTGAEYRAASAVDIALWDIFGKVCNQPVHQMLGGLCRDRLRIYNTCAGYKYVRSHEHQAGLQLEPRRGRRALRGPGRLHDPGRRAGREPAGERDHGHEDLAVRSCRHREPRPLHHRRADEDGDRALREDQEGGRRQDRDHGRVPLAVEPADRQEDRQGARALRADLVRGPDPHELAAGAGRVRALDQTSGSAPARRWAHAGPTRRCWSATRSHVAMVDLCWTGGLTEGRKIAALAETWHRPFAPHDCIGPVGFVAAVHASFSQPNTLIQESVRAFYTGWYKELVTDCPDDQGRPRLPDGGPRPGHRAAARPSSSAPT